MDRTIVNLTSLLLGGAGIFAVFTEYSVPELQATFIGSNPFARKAEIIKGVMTAIFTAVALLALLVQAAAEIAGEELPQRRHPTVTYCAVFAAGVLLTALLVVGLAGIGRRIAKARWFPEMVSAQGQLFEAARFVSDHDGWREDQLSLKDRLADPEKYRAANLKDADARISQVERLLECEAPGGTDLSERVARLAPYFDRSAR